MRRSRVTGIGGVSAAALVAVTGCGETPIPQARYTPEQLNSSAVPNLADDGVQSAPRVEELPPPAPPPAPPAPARVRVIHASPDRAAASVDVYLGDVATPAVSALAYKAIAGAVDAPAGAAHRVSLQRAGVAASAARVASAQTPEVESGAQYTAVAFGLATGAPALGVAVGRDETAEPEAGQARARFFHALVGLGAVDLCTAATPAVAARAGQAARPAQPPRAVFENVAFGTFSSGYAAVPAGAPVALQVRLRASASARACAGLVRGAVTLTPGDRAVVTAVAVGRAVGAPAVSRELLVCPDRVAEGAPTCATVAIR